MQTGRITVRGFDKRLIMKDDMSKLNPKLV